MNRNIKLGIKISTENFDFIPDIYENKDIIDYIEISIKANFNSKDLKTIQSLQLPYAIHLPTSRSGIDFGDNRKDMNNLDFIENISRNFKLLKDLNPICYIIHPESGDINHSIKNLKKLKIKPLALENMPVKGIYGGELLAFNPNTIKKFFMEMQELKFCFDINHAIKASISLNLDYLTFIKDFIKFKKPLIYHIAGGDLDLEIDDHLNLDDGQYDLTEIKKILFNQDETVYLTFETPRNDENKIDDDLMNMNIFLKS